MTWQTWLVIGVVVAACLALAAYRGHISWQWPALALGAAVAAAAGAFARLAGRRGVQPPAPPSGRPGAETATPIVNEADRVLDADRDRVRDAESDEDRLERLRRLADLNDGGRGGGPE